MGGDVWRIIVWLERSDVGLKVLNWQQLERLGNNNLGQFHGNLVDLNKTLNWQQAKKETRALWRFNGNLVDINKI